MLPLELFKRRNFAFGNLQTFAMYGGLGAMFFFLTLFLQQVAGYEALEAGIATIPTTLVMFSLSKRAGRLADRFGPRLLHGLRAAGERGRHRADAAPGRGRRLLDRALPGAADLLARPRRHGHAVDRDRAGRRRRAQRRHRLGRQQRDRARRRACCASPRSARSSPPSTRATWAALDVGDTLEVIPGVPESVAASVHAFHVGIGVCAALVGLGGVLGLVGIRNPRREVRCEDCAEGALLRPGAALPARPGARARAPLASSRWPTPPRPCCAPASSRRCSTARPAGSPAPACRARRAARPHLPRLRRAGRDDGARPLQPVGSSIPSSRRARFSFLRRALRFGGR